MPRSAPKQVVDLEFDGLDHDFAGLDLGEIEQVVHQLREVSRRLADVTDLLLLFRGRSPSIAIAAACAESARIEFSGVRNSWLMFDRKRDLDLVGAAQVIGPLIEFRIERDDAAVGVLQFRVQHFAVLPGACAVRRSVRINSWFCSRNSSRIFFGACVLSPAGRDQPRQHLRRYHGRTARQLVIENHVVPRAGVVSTLKTSIRRLAPRSPGPCRFPDRYWPSRISPDWECPGPDR